MNSIQLNDVLFDKLNSYYKKYEVKDTIWREECLFCYDSPKNSIDEYYICLSTYIGFCKKHIPLYLNDTKKFFVSIKRIPNCIDASTSKNIPKKLGIGLEGGFESTMKFTEDFYVTVGDKCHMQRLIYDPAVIPNDISALIHAIRYYSQSGQFIPWSDSEAPESIDWKCSQCELNTNLWMNLTDGVINCGRRNFDGSGGNNHAYEHYAKTKYPLAVKLTSLDSTCVELFSYVEDKMVKDSHIDFHLNHFGIDRRTLSRLEKTITEKEIEANINLKGEMDVILEHGVKLQQLFGPGYTGVINNGNTFSLLKFPQYFIPDNISAASISPLVDDVFYQLCKFCHYLHSEQYSTPVFNNDGVPTCENDGILPIMLIHALIKDHAEFKTSRQQDVTEFFMYLCELLASRDEIFSKKSEFYKPASINHLFNFTVKEYFQLKDSLTDIHVRESTEKILRLHIPEDKIEKIPRLFQLDVSIPMPKLLNISSYASIPDFEHPLVISPSTKPVKELESVIRKAMTETNSSGVTEALDWIQSHSGNITTAGKFSDISDSMVNNLVSMGFSKDSSLKALAINNGILERALEYLLVNMDCIEQDYAQLEANTPDLTLDIDPSSIEVSNYISEAKYELVSFISHIGSSSVTGHYVCHVHKDDQWVIYNDQQVAESIDPPFDRGYLYFYRRKDN
ncbi:hypothetical protein MXB_2477 [Myxobolus squamalis]|nr:hypothetical protein MXB_2477 [Myxobolus squamalis]